jgi:replicative DNA helicase
MSDLRESGTIEQDADVIMLMHRDRVSDTMTDAVDTDVLIAKNRNGACGMAKLIFIPRFAMFTDRVR